MIRRPKRVPIRRTLRDYNSPARRGCKKPVLLMLLGITFVIGTSVLAFLYVPSTLGGY